ncbi:MAG: hypothetical protein ACYTKD_17155 [Planctomycetota bacterium]
MADFAQGTDHLTVSGPLRCEDFDHFLDCGRSVLDTAGSEVLLTFTDATVEDSKFIGAVAQFAAEARARSVGVTIRAQGRAADMLAWAGLHRLAALEIAATTPVGRQ